MTLSSFAAATPFPLAEGLEFRPLVPGDVDSWLALVQRIEAFEETPWRTQRSELAAVVSDSVNPAEDNTVAGFDADGVLRAYGAVAKGSGGEKADLRGGVDPLWRRRGVGAAVLAWQESQAGARFAADASGAAASGAAAAKVRIHGEENNVGLRAMLSAAEYSVVRYYAQMQRNLDRIPEVPVPAGITIVTLTAGLSDAVRLAHNEAFADHWGSEPRSPERWAVQMRHEHMRLDLSTVAVDDASGEVAAYQLATVDPDAVVELGAGELGAGEGGLGEGYTELLGVRRAWRGRGLAPAMLADAMNRFAAAGLGVAGLDVDTENPTGVLGLYERMGYLPVRRTMVWDKLL